MKRTSVRTESQSGRQAKKTNSYGPSKIPQYFPGEKKKTKVVPDFGKLHEKWQKQLEVGKICNKKPQTVPTEFKLSKSNKADPPNNAKKQLFSDEEFEADHKSLEAILRGLPGRGIASRRATTATGRDVKRSQSCNSIGSRRVLGELPLDPDQTSKANRRRSRSARAEIPLKVLKESAEVKFEPDPQALRSIISSEGMTPSRVAAPKRQTTTGAVIRQERPSIYDAMTSSRHLNSKFAAVQMANKASKVIHPKNRPPSSPVQRATQACRDPPQNNLRKQVEQQPQSLAEEFEVDPQSMRNIINSEGLTPVRVTAPVRKTLGGPVIRQERPSIYDAMTSSRNSVFGNVRLSEYRAGPRTGKLLIGAASSPAPTVFPLGRTPAKGPVPDLIKSATKSEARRVLRNECGILGEGPSKKPGEQKHVKWADVFEESITEEKDNVQRTLFTTVEDSEEDDECKENICPVTKQLTPAKTGQQSTVKSIPQYTSTGQWTINNGQKTAEAKEVQVLPSNLNNNNSKSVAQTSSDPKTEGSSEIYGLVSHLSNDLEVGGESRGFASSTDGTVYKRGLFPCTADKANCHDESPHVSEDVLPISGDGSSNRERVTHSCVVAPQAYSRQYAGDTQCFSNLRNATCSELQGLRAANLEFTKNLGNRSSQGLQNSKEGHSIQGLQNVEGSLAEISNHRLQNPKGKFAHLQSKNAQASSNGLERIFEHKKDNGVFRDGAQTQKNLETVDHTLVSSNELNAQIIKESQPTSSRSLDLVKDCREQGKHYACIKNLAQCDEQNFNSEAEKIRHFPNYIVSKQQFQEHGGDDKQSKETVVRPYSAGLGDQCQEGQCDVRKLVITKEILVEQKREQTTMAMFTETEQDDNSQAPSTSTREQASSGERTRDSVGNFVGRVQKNKKRQSIAELNESISESNVHMQSLCNQAQSLRNQSKMRKNTNIMYQLELIRKQQEELLKLQRELQQQLQMEAEYQEVEGHTDNQRDESGNFALDAKVSDLISSSEQMLTLQSDEQTQNLESIQEEERNNNNYDSPFVVKSPLIPCSIQESFSVSQPSGLPLASNTLLSTPKAPHISDIVQKSLLTPRLSNLTCDSQNRFPFIQSPKPLKPAPPSKREGAKSPSPPPIWTAMALKSEAERHSTSDPSTPSTKRRLEQEPDYAKAADEPMDLSLKSLTETSFNSSAEHLPLNKRSMTSESTLSTSSPKLFHSQDIGSLSLRANTLQSQIISHNVPSSHPSSRHFQPTQEIPLYKEVLSIANEQRYREALLDDECARYCCRLQAAQSLVFWSERCINPVSIVLSQGDEMHFVPIHEELILPVTVGGDSAFYSYSP
ncbi:uncharacterized protein LOC133194168 [Saccostrea echinata]|uniref:uncharacterized protein LOC133194168 n=1 Tax=Saccostrea echinata TaxID=191078 RepID=UPI002A81E175|nr:uncharacterized protein LOC133194168 [Saccostrea echinata]